MVSCSSYKNNRNKRMQLLKAKNKQGYTQHQTNPSLHKSLN